MKKSKKQKFLKLVFLISMLPVFFASTYILSRRIFQDGPGISMLVEEIDAAVRAVLIDNRIETSMFRKNYVKKQEGDVHWEQIEMVVDLEETDSLPHLSGSLTDALTMPGVFISKKRELAGDIEQQNLTVYHHHLPLYQILLRKRISPPAEEPRIPAAEDEEAALDELPKIAIIVDDIGYDVDLAMELINLRQKLTLSIFPQLLHSRHIAETAHKLGFEIMMHLPMEPGEKLRRNPGFISQKMNRKQLFWMLDRDLDSIPYVIGVNNHQGSKMTRDEETMELVMSYLAAKHLFFIDSRTTSDSIAHAVAQRSGIKSAENDVFLDNEKECTYIKERMEKLISEAQEKGKAIGICHAHPVTIEALRETLPLLEQQGVRLVYASEVVE
jgi:polysaccharide deacetylase 2 family uncharacterized protein YibQ